MHYISNNIYVIQYNNFERIIIIFISYFWYNISFCYCKSYFWTGKRRPRLDGTQSPRNDSPTTWASVWTQVNLALSPHKSFKRTVEIAWVIEASGSPSPLPLHHEPNNSMATATLHLPNRRTRFSYPPQVLTHRRWVSRKSQKFSTQIKGSGGGRRRRSGKSILLLYGT